MADSPSLRDLFKKAGKVVADSIGASKPPELPDPYATQGVFGESLLDKSRQDALDKSSEVSSDAAGYVAKKAGLSPEAQEYAKMAGSAVPNIVSMIATRSPKSAAVAVRPDKGFGKTIVTGIKETGFREAKEQAAQSAANLAKELPNSAARDLAKEAVATLDPAKIKEFLQKYPEQGRKFSSMLYNKKAAMEAIRARKP